MCVCDSWLTMLAVQLAVCMVSLEHWGSVGLYTASLGALDQDRG